MHIEREEEEDKNEKIVQVGGLGGSRDLPLDTVNVYDVATDQWVVSTSKLTRPRAYLSCCLVSSTVIFAIGGEGEDNKLTVERKSVEDIISDACDTQWQLI